MLSPSIMAITRAARWARRRGSSACIGPEPPSGGPGRIASDPDIDGIELNVSCPNVADGLVFGTDPVLLRQVVRAVRDAMRPACRLVVKLSPNVGDITVTAAAAVEGANARCNRRGQCRHLLAGKRALRREMAEQ